MANRLKAARQLAKKNNMEFRNDYIKRYNEKVNPHNFKEGQLVYLHRPEMVKINPKLQSEWFGPFVILSMVGEHNSLIQDLASRRTKFVNCNRLRAYNLTSDEWKNFKFKLARQSAEDGHSTIQRTANKPDSANATAPVDYALFDRDSDIVVLTPHSRPQPKVLKVEQRDAEAIVSEEPATDPVQPIDHEGESSTRIFTDNETSPNLLSGMGHQLMKLVSPPKKGQKNKQKGLKLANLPREEGGSLTRRTARRVGLQLPAVFGEEWNRNPP